MSPQTTQAWRYHKGGLLPNILKLDEVDVPEPGPGEILVEVQYASLNPVDYKVPQNLSFATKKPRTAAADFSGKVSSLGAGNESKGLQVGDDVYGFIPADVGMKNGRGSLAKKVLVSSQFVEKIPPGYTAEQAAGLTLVGLTALELADHAQKGERVLVTGGSTSVGLLLIKMLKAKGCSLVVATGSGSKMETIRARGADDVVDYRAEDFPKQLVISYSKQPFDVVLDTVGDAVTHSGCGSYLKKGGHYWNVGANGLTPGAGGLLPFMKFVFSAFLLPTFLGGVPAKFHMTGLKAGEMPRFAGLVKAPQAYQRLMEGRALGKINVEVTK